MELQLVVLQLLPQASLHLVLDLSIPTRVALFSKVALEFCASPMFEVSVLQPSASANLDDILTHDLR